MRNSAEVKRFCFYIVISAEPCWHFQRRYFPSPAITDVCTPTLEDTGGQPAKVETGTQESSPTICQTS